MKANEKKSGFTLTEMVVVIAIVTLMVSLAMPAVRSLYNSMGDSSGGTTNMISGALATAKAIAIKEHRYAGIRFQKMYRSDDNILNADQYMIFIVKEGFREMHNIPDGFRAVKGINPIKLPTSIGVMDLWFDTTSQPELLDTDIENRDQLIDRTAFSVIFSPEGKLAIQSVWVKNRDGHTEGTQTLNSSSDEVFNTLSKVKNGIGKFVQDDGFPEYPTLQREQSRRCFVIYDRGKFKQAYNNGRAYSDYLWELIPEMIYINRYTGTIINREK